MQDISDQVAKDAEDQFAMVQNSGTPIDKCVQAGMVSAAYLQAKRSDKYDHWKTIERGLCASAGLPSGG